MNILNYLKSPNWYASILKTQLKSDSSFKQLFISPDSSLVFILFLSSYLSWNSVFNRSSAERNSKRYHQLLNLQGAWLYPMLSISNIRSYQQYSRPTDVSDVISWLNKPEDLWNITPYFKSFCNSNLNGNSCPLNYAGWRALTWFNTANGCLYFGTKHLKKAWFLLLLFLISIQVY